MAQLVVRGIENDVKVRLQRRARRNGRSMEEEVRSILRGAMREGAAATSGLGTEISRLFSKTGLNSPIAELQGHKVEPVAFKR